MWNTHIFGVRNVVKQRNGFPYKVTEIGASQNHAK